MNLAYGRLNILKEFKISNSTFTCKNNINLFDDFPIFYFNCSINTPDKKKNKFKKYRKFVVNYFVKFINHLFYIYN